MSGAPKITILLIVTLCAGLTVSACGEDRSHLLPGDNVQEISTNLDTVQSLVDEGQCFDALEAAAEVQNQAEALPRSVDAQLKRTLIDGVIRLTELVGRQCEDDPAAGTTDEVEPVEPDTEVTPTGDTGTTTDDEETGTTGSTGPQNNGNQNNRPDRQPTTPTPEPEPDTPTTPSPPTNVPPDTGGPGTGGISPNP